MGKSSNSCDNPSRKTGGKGGMRSKATIQRLNMYKNGNPIRNKEGKIVGGTLMMADRAGDAPIGKFARIQPDRRWFGNTRMISADDLDKFRSEMKTRMADPYSVILRQKKIPIALLKESADTKPMNLTETESFESVFGSKNTRKRPKLSQSLSDMSAFLAASAEKYNSYNKEDDIAGNIDLHDGSSMDQKDDLFSKGQSKRIWGELYKVLDCSDVVLQILDARNVPGTRCLHVEKYLQQHARHKQLVIVINKCDLVPSWVTRKWVKILSEQFPTVAFHASVTNSFGKGSLISLLRQFGKLHADKRNISVGVIGYPNCGKSSVINTLMGKKCCKAAPVPGETKVWQYVTLMKRIFLIDSPGVVYDIGDSEVDTVLKGVVRAERLQTPSDFIQDILDRVKPEYIRKQYNIESWTDAVDFLNQLCARTGKLLKKGEPDYHSVSINMINDWQRGKLPHFVAPPRSNEDKDTIVEEDDLPIVVSDVVENRNNIEEVNESDMDEDEEDYNEEDDEEDDSK